MKLMSANRHDSEENGTSKKNTSLLSENVTSPLITIYNETIISINSIFMDFSCKPNRRYMIFATNIRIIIR
jgi:hypothetical protein